LIIQTARLKQEPPVSDPGLLRKDWDLIQKEETRLLQAMTVQESLNQWLGLQRAFEWQLQKTEALFAAERRAALAELQNRLQRLVER
jgi:hypothetical protein